MGTVCGECKFHYVHTVILLFSIVSFITLCELMTNEWSKFFSFVKPDEEIPSQVDDRYAFKRNEIFLELNDS